MVLQAVGLLFTNLTPLDLMTSRETCQRERNFRDFELTYSSVAKVLRHCYCNQLLNWYILFRLSVSITVFFQLVIVTVNWSIFCSVIMPFQLQTYSYSQLKQHCPKAVVSNDWSILSDLKQPKKFFEVWLKVEWPKCSHYTFVPLRQHDQSMTYVEWW